MISCRKLDTACGAEITGFNAGRPISAMDAEELRALLREYGLLIVRDQDLSKQQQVEFSRVFGELAIHPLAHQVDPEVPELLVLDSHGRDGNIEPENPEEVVGLIDWHSDLAYVAKPNYAGLLHGRILPPEGGLTGFVDRQATYEALPEDVKAEIDGLTVVQSWRHSQEQIAKNPAFRTDEGAKVMNLDLFPDLGFPLVFAHPMTGKKVLNVAHMWSSEIVELPGAKGHALLDQLLDHTIKPEFVYWHSHRQGDVVIWDNYRMIHAASGTKGKYRRQMYRTTIDGNVELGGLPINAEEVAAAQDRIAQLRKETLGA